MNFKRKRRSEGACLTIDDSTLLASISFSFGIKFLYLLLSIHIIYYLRNVIFLIKLKIRWKFSKNFYSDLINQTFLFWVNIYIYFRSWLSQWIISHVSSFQSVMIIRYVSLFSNAIRFSSSKNRQTSSHLCDTVFSKKGCLTINGKKNRWKSVAERRKSERHVDWQGEEGAGRRENALEDEMGPEETVNPLARGLSSATFLFSHSTSRLLEILKNPKKKKRETHENLDKL